MEMMSARTAPAGAPLAARPVGWTPSRALLAAGAAGPIFFLAVATQAGLLDPSYDVRTQPVSALAWGSNGWIQTANFYAFGLSVISFALALRRSFAGRGRLAAAILLALSGLSLIAAGLFPGGPRQAPNRPSAASSTAWRSFAPSSRCPAPTPWPRCACRRSVGGAGTRCTRPPCPRWSSASWSSTRVLGSDPGDPLYGVSGLMQRALIAVAFGWITVTGWRLMRRPVATGRRSAKAVGKQRWGRTVAGERGGASPAQGSSSERDKENMTPRTMAAGSDRSSPGKQVIASDASAASGWTGKGLCPEPLARFVRGVEGAGEEEGYEDEAVAESVACALARLVAEPGWLAEEHGRGWPDRYRQHVLYVAPDGGFSVVALLWQPGQRTPIHDHVSWCVVGVYEGEEEETRYRLHEGVGGRFLVLDERERTRRADVTTLIPPDEDIHEVANAGTGKAISIHVYGAGIGRLGSSINRTFDRLPILPDPADAPRVSWRR